MSNEHDEGWAWADQEDPSSRFPAELYVCSEGKYGMALGYFHDEQWWSFDHGLIEVEIIAWRVLVASSPPDQFRAKELAMEN